MTLTLSSGALVRLKRLRCFKIGSFSSSIRLWVIMGGVQSLCKPYRRRRRFVFSSSEMSSVSVGILSLSRQVRVRLRSFLEMPFSIQLIASCRDFTIACRCSDSVETEIGLAFIMMNAIMVGVTLILSAFSVSLSRAKDSMKISAPLFENSYRPAMNK